MDFLKVFYVLLMSMKFKIIIIQFEKCCLKMFYMYSHHRTGQTEQ